MKVFVRILHDANTELLYFKKDLMKEDHYVNV